MLLFFNIFSNISVILETREWAHLYIKFSSNCTAIIYSEYTKGIIESSVITIHQHHVTVKIKICCAIIYCQTMIRATNSLPFYMNFHCY